MLNIEEFTKRLQKVISYYGESASSFAEKIGVQRSSISHILSGRNKPSLEFILKVLSFYPDVELYWLLNGKGSFPKKEHIEPKNNINLPSKTSEPLSLFNQEKETIKTSHEKTIDRIVIFYSDGSFKNYKN